jgi:hypothetical protein
LQLEIGAGRLSRVLDVTVNGQVFSAAVYGGGKVDTTVGEVQLAADQDMVITVERGRPAERGTVLDIDVKKIILRPVVSARP